MLRALHELTDFKTLIAIWERDKIITCDIREVKRPVPGHTANKRQSWDLNSQGLDLESLLLTCISLSHLAHAPVMGELSVLAL